MEANPHAALNRVGVRGAKQGCGQERLENLERNRDPAFSRDDALPRPECTPSRAENPSETWMQVLESQYGVFAFQEPIGGIRIEKLQIRSKNLGCESRVGTEIGNFHAPSLEVGIQVGEGLLKALPILAPGGREA